MKVEHMLYSRKGREQCLSMDTKQYNAVLKICFVARFVHSWMWMDYWIWTSETHRNWWILSYQHILVTNICATVHINKLHSSFGTSSLLGPQVSSDWLHINQWLAPIYSNFNGLKSSPQFFSSSPKAVNHLQFTKLKLWLLDIFIIFCHQHSSFWVLAEYLANPFHFTENSCSFMYFPGSHEPHNFLIINQSCSSGQTMHLNWKKLYQSILWLISFWSFIIRTLGHPHQVFLTYLFPLGFVSLQPLKRCWLVHIITSDQLTITSGISISILTSLQIAV
jgi:hypothetical protein